MELITRLILNRHLEIKTFLNSKEGAQMKNIIICSDGTWQSPESDTSTHVLRLAEGIAPEDAAGNKQVVFYDWGVGSEGDKWLPKMCRRGLRRWGAPLESFSHEWLDNCS
jgi:uncharacterized protein (DUF2235 family)